MGHLTWPIIRDNLADVITVTEEEIISAMRLVWERMKLLIEPSAAVGVAAVLTKKFQALPAQDVKNVAVILCGGNVDLDNLPWKNSLQLVFPAFINPPPPLTHYLCHNVL